MKNIPKILHLFWDGSKMSYLQTITPLSFHKLNPDWKIKIHYITTGGKGNEKYVPNYTGDDFSGTLKSYKYIEFIPVDLKEYPQLNNLSSILKSDYLRMIWLRDEGGLWSDFDVIWLKSIKELTETKAVENSLSSDKWETMTCRYNGVGHYSIGVLFSTPNNPIILNLLKEADRKLKFNKVISFQGLGPDLWFETYKNNWDYLPYENIVHFNYHLFYPFSIFNLKVLYEMNINPDSMIKESVCLHWFAGHLLSKNYINNPDSLKINNTINNLIRVI